MTPALPPLALYVHLPWCVQKCPYCDFNSHPLHDALPADAYGAALLRDLDWEWTTGDADIWRGRELVSVFFGGGTPSLFPPETIAAVLEAADSRFGLAADCE
ncbi:MAG: oxygen-independent coproporphyrinogen III oxidase-like protein, partial [Algiphilus sp.]